MFFKPWITTCIPCKSDPGPPQQKILGQALSETRMYNIKIHFMTLLEGLSKCVHMYKNVFKII